MTPYETERLAMVLFDRALDKNQRSIENVAERKRAFKNMPTWLEAGTEIRNQYRNAATTLMSEYPNDHPEASRS